MALTTETVAVESPESLPTTKKVRPRRRWKRWLIAAIAAFALLIGFLPTLASLPMFRGVLFSALMPALNSRVTVDDLSLGWFTPIRVGGVRLQGDDGKKPALTINEVAGDISLWNLLTGGQLGEFRVDQAKIFVEFDQDGSNWQRLIKEFQGTPKLDRHLKLKIVEAEVSLQGPTSAQPWSLDKLSTNVSFTPAVANPHGVPLIEGDQLVLLNEAELTPELCNDLLKYIVPSLAGVTRTSGRVSLEVQHYSWPIGKPDAADVKGQLTLHSVDMGPGAIADSLSGVMQGLNLPASLKVAKDDAVPFWIENGRVHHKDFAFGLIDLQPDRLIRTHGSVGFDQTLDVVIDMPIIGSAYLPEGKLRDALMKKNVMIEVTGTLQAAKPKLQLPADTDLSPVLQGIGELLERRQERLRENPPQRPGLLRNSRRASEESRPAR